MHRLQTLWLWCILLATLTAQAQRLAVIDKSRPADAGLSQVQLDLYSQAIRGEVRNQLPESVQILTEESTVVILRDMGVDLKDCSGDCEVEVARNLQADWLVSVSIVRLGASRNLQLNLFETGSASLLASESGRAADEGALMDLALQKAGLLCLRVRGTRSDTYVGEIGQQPSDWNPDELLGEVVCFESEPPGATVNLDGSYLGETPLTREVPRGPHQLEWVLPRYETLQEVVSITHKETLQRQLTPLFGWLTVESTPSDQPVFLDGQPTGRTPLVRQVLGHGAHTVLVGDSLLAYPQGERFVLDKGDHKTLRYTIPPREGALVVRCKDSGSNVMEVPVSVNGKAVGTSPLQLKLPIGEHEVQAGGVRQKVRLREKVVETVTLTVAPMTITPSGQSVAGDLPGMTFVTIPAGTYTIGSPGRETGRESDESQHQVILSAYEMMTTEVTQAQWRAVMGRNPSHFKGDNLPVEKVSWHNVQDFLGELNRLHPGRNYRLPTEAEWEVACRAGATGRFCNGNSEGKLAEVGWYTANSGRKTHPVAQKLPNAWGLYDMHGNVWEWCQDWYGSYDGGTQRDPRGPRSGSRRVCRGGSWSYDASHLRCAYRSNYDPGSSNTYLGFRLSRTP